MTSHQVHQLAKLMDTIETRRKCQVVARGDISESGTDLWAVDNDTTAEEFWGCVVWSDKNARWEV